MTSLMNSPSFGQSQATIANAATTIDAPVYAQMTTAPAANTSNDQNGLTGLGAMGACGSTTSST